MEAHERKRTADSENDLSITLPVLKRARFELIETLSEEKSLTNSATPSSPRSIANVSATATSFTSRSTSKRPKRYVCDYDGCDKAFDRPVRLQAHVRTHTNDRPFVCVEEGCTKTFFKAEHLKAHVQNKHSNEANYVCTYVMSTAKDGEEVECGKAFTTSTRLRRHAALHEKAEELKCQEQGCSQVFRKMETLQRHIKKEHLKEESFRCGKMVEDELSGAGEECGQTFSTVGQLKAHETREHVGMKYFCSTCSPPPEDGSAPSVGFPTYAEYQAHLKTVHPPTCIICDQPCASNRALAAHMEIEHSTLSSRKENYRCAYSGCERGFTRKGNLNVHVQSVHVKKKKFVCGEFDLSGNAKCPGWSSALACGSAFTTKASLEGHVRTQHLDLPNLYHERTAPKIKEEENAATARIAPSFHAFNEPAEANYFNGENDALGLVTGHNYAALRPISCWMLDCPVRFHRNHDLMQHMELAHGWNIDDVHDRLAEKEALQGGQFWIGGTEDNTVREQPGDFGLSSSLSQGLSLQSQDSRSSHFESDFSERARRALSAGFDVEFFAEPTVGSSLPRIMGDNSLVVHEHDDEMVLDPALVGF